MTPSFYRVNYRAGFYNYGMDTITLLSLFNDLETQYGLKPLRMMNIIEKYGNVSIYNNMRDFNIRVKLLVDA